ncbi:hypothetical protein J4463_00565 [Candidatus Pacearchaeota archaeon]|nr:hypothetical protein [Candidatus Pacearchaeota archaeon]
MKYNIPGVIVGIGMFLIAGYLFGASYSLLLSKIQKDIYYIILIAVIISLLVLMKLINLSKIRDKISGTLP